MPTVPLNPGVMAVVLTYTIWPLAAVTAKLVSVLVKLTAGPPLSETVPAVPVPLVSVMVS